MSSLQFFSILLDDKCQFWLKESTKVLTSPYFGSLTGSGQHYPHNMNCTWILKAEEGSIVNIDIDYFMVKNSTLPLLLIWFSLTKNSDISHLCFTCRGCTISSFMKYSVIQFS